MGLDSDFRRSSVDEIDLDLNLDLELEEDGDGDDNKEGGNRSGLEERRMTILRGLNPIPTPTLTSSLGLLCKSLVD